MKLSILAAVFSAVLVAASPAPGPESEVLRKRACNGTAASECAKSCSYQKCVTLCANNNYCVSQCAKKCSDCCYASCTTCYRRP